MNSIFAVSLTAHVYQNINTEKTITVTSKLSSTADCVINYTINAIESLK